MPIDASIIPTKQTIPDFSGFVNSLMGLQKNNLAIEQGNLQLQQLQQEMALNKASSKAIQQNTDQNGNVNIPGVISMLSKSPEAATNLAPTITSLLGQQGTQQENIGKQLGNLVQKNTISGQRLGGLVEKIKKGGTVTPEEHAKEMANLIAEGVLTPDEALLHLRMAPTPTGDKKKDQDAYHNFIEQELFATQTNSDQINKILGTLQPGANGQPPSVYNALTQTLNPVQFANPNQPQQQTNLAPGAPGTPPGQFPSAPPQAQGKQQAQDPILPQLQFPVRQPGTNYAPLPNEDTKTTEGGQYVSSLIDRKKNLVTDRRNLDEMLKQVEKVKEETMRIPGGELPVVGGAVNLANKGIRYASSMVADPKYQQLSKDIANMQISNLKASGGSMDTVAGQALQAHANGSEVYDPDVLLNIGRRAKADMKNLDLQTDAATKFLKRYGPNNMDTFKKIWGDNADSKLFEMMAHHEDKTMTSEQKKQKRDELAGITPEMSAEKKKELLKEFKDKHKVIEKLVNTGGL